MFKLDGPIHRFLARMLDLIILNVLWTICCLPIVTIGASTAALYSVMYKIKEGKDANVFKQFFVAFKDNFLQALFGTLIMLALAALLYADYNIVFVEKLFGSAVMQALFFVVLTIAVGFFGWLFPMIARFENSFGKQLKNAFSLSLANFPVTLLLTALNACPVLLLYFFPEFSAYYLVTFWVFLGFSLIARVNSLILCAVFKKYAEPKAEDS